MSLKPTKYEISATLWSVFVSSSAAFFKRTDLMKSLTDRSVMALIFLYSTGWLIPTSFARSCTTKLVSARCCVITWLQLGFCGHQAQVADYYTSTGSLYMATLSFLPLGLPVDDEFWSAPAAAWTAAKAWAGEDFVKDYHVNY